MESQAESTIYEILEAGLRSLCILMPVVRYRVRRIRGSGRSIGSCAGSGDTADTRTVAAARGSHRFVPGRIGVEILAASTYTVEIVEADRWMQAHSDLRRDSLAVEVDKQSWDPSVQALTEFPSVLANMDRNLAWTSSLGDAWLNRRP